MKMIDIQIQSEFLRILDRALRAGPIPVYHNNQLWYIFSSPYLEYDEPTLDHVHITLVIDPDNPGEAWERLPVKYLFETVFFLTRQLSSYNTRSSESRNQDAIHYNLFELQQRRLRANMIKEEAERTRRMIAATDDSVSSAGMAYLEPRSQKEAEAFERNKLREDLAEVAGPEPECFEYKSLNLKIIEI